MSILSSLTYLSFSSVEINYGGNIFVPKDIQWAYIFRSSPNFGVILLVPLSGTFNYFSF